MIRVLNKKFPIKKKKVKVKTKNKIKRKMVKIKTKRINNKKIKRSLNPLH